MPCCASARALDWWIERAGRAACRAMRAARMLAALVLVEDWTPAAIVARLRRRPLPAGAARSREERG